MDNFTKDKASIKKGLQGKQQNWENIKTKIKNKFIFNKILETIDQKISELEDGSEGKKG